MRDAPQFAVGLFQFRGAFSQFIEQLFDSLGRIFHSSDCCHFSGRLAVSFPADTFACYFGHIDLNLLEIVILGGRSEF